MDQDVVDLVAGAGGGLAGALRAAELGMSVLVIEKNPHFAVGNNTAMSTAMIPGAGSRWQRSADIEDPCSDFLPMCGSRPGEPADPVVAATLSGVSARLVEWLADVVGLGLSLVTDFSYPVTAGHAVTQPGAVHTPGRSRGRSRGAGPRVGSAPDPGVYAGGGAVVGMSGAGADGYLAGNGLLAASAWRSSLTSRSPASWIAERLRPVPPPGGRARRRPGPRGTARTLRSLTATSPAARWLAT